MLLGLAALADRGAAIVAGRLLAAEVQRTADLGSRPDVRVAGFPFLTQVAEGTYRRIEVDAVDVPADDVVLRRLSLRLSGVEVPLREALSGRLRTVPVDRVRASAVLGFDEVARRAGGRDLVVSAAGEDVRVRGSVRVLGQVLDVAATSRLAVDDGQLVVTATSYDVGGGLADELLTRALAGRLDVRVPLPALPYGLRVDGVDVQPDGVAVLAGARDTVLSAP